MKKSILLAIILNLLSCSEGLNNVILNSNPIQKGSILLIDEANQILNCINPLTKAVFQISYVGNAANDIEIDNDTAYIVASLNDTLFKIDLKNGGFIKTLSLVQNFGSRPNPWNVAYDDSNIYVSLCSSNQIVVINKSNYSISRFLDLSISGCTAGITADNQYLYISSFKSIYETDQNCKVLIIDKTSFSEITNISVESNPQSITLDENGNLWAACTGRYNTSLWSYEGGALLKLIKNNSSFSVVTILSNIQVWIVKYNNGNIYALDSKFGITKSGLNILTTNGNYITNLLENKDLKGLAFDESHIYVSDGYGGSCVYIINKNDYTIDIISNVGGGDLAFYY